MVGATTISGSSTNTFGALWMDDNLTLSGTGATTTDTLHVGKALTISSTVGANTFGVHLRDRELLHQRRLHQRDRRSDRCGWTAR